MEKEYVFDFVALGKALKRKMLPLILCTSLGGGIGFLTTQFITPKWKAEVQLDAPTVAQLGNYFNLLSTYQLIEGDGLSYKLLKDEKGELSVAPILSERAEKQAVELSYREFKRSLQSPDVLQQFLAQSELVKLRAQAINRPINEVTEQLTKQFHYQAANRSVPYERVSVTSTNPEEAYQLLRDFIHFANIQARNQLNAELIAKWKALFQQVELAATKQLGAIAQGEQIAVQDWAGKLAIMQGVKPLDNQLLAYRFMQSPKQPTQPISPNASFAIMLGSLAGFLLAIFGYATLQLFRKEKHNAA